MKTCATQVMQPLHIIVLLVLINGAWAAEPSGSQTSGAGGVTCPATLAVKVSTNVLSATSEARLFVVLKNVSTNTIFWTERNPPIGNFIVSIADTSARPYILTPPTQPGDTKHRLLRPGQSREATIPLHISSNIPAGDYELSVTYEYVLLPGEKPKTWKPQSNRIAVQVR
jgi:hypothetical protein